MEPLLVSLFAIFGGVVTIPPAARRLGMPVIVAELLFGILIGASFFDIIPREAPTLEFFSAFGLVYLMFLAGIETNFVAIFREGALGKALAVSVVSLLLPFVTGVGISRMMDVHPLLLGTILCTTSIGLVLPLLKEIDVSKGFSQILMGSVTMVDISSIFLLAFVLALIEGNLGAEFAYGLLFMLTLLLIPFVVCRKNICINIERRIAREAHFDFEIRLAFALIFLLASLSNYLGFHAIVGAYIAGVIASEVLAKDPVEEKLQSFGYGFFIPLFFILAGSRVNLFKLFATAHDVWVLLVFISAALISKAVGVSIVAGFLGLDRRESIALGCFHCARLSLIIAAAEVSLKLGLVDEGVFASLVVLAVVSGLVAPALGKYSLGRMR